VIAAVEKFSSIDVTTQPVAQARANERQQPRLTHDAATHDDSLRRHGHDQLCAQLPKIVCLDFPLRMKFIEPLQRGARAGNDGRTRGDAF